MSIWLGETGLEINYVLSSDNPVFYVNSCAASPRLKLEFKVDDAE